MNRLADAGVDFGVFLSGFADILRAQLTVVLNGKSLPLRQAQRLDLGSRLDDGAINGSFDWPDGGNFHVEQFAGSPLAVAMFSFSEGEARWSCRPAR